VPRYMVERSFPQPLSIPLNSEGRTVCQTIVHGNAELGVTWLHSYVSPDRQKTFCIYDAPNADAIRRAAEKSKIPVDVITEVTDLSPYMYGV
jgi:uncharacterized protein DUF4242